MTEWKAVLDMLAVFKLPIKITEYDYETERIESPVTTEPPYNAQSEERKAQSLGDFYRLCFSHPAVEGIIMWGCWEGAHWRPGAAILNLDFSPKPAADTYRKLVFGEWWTKTTGETNSEGRFATRAFYGSYHVKVETRDGRTEEKTFDFPKGTQEPLSVVFAVKTSQTVKPDVPPPTQTPPDKGVTPPPTESPRGGFSCSRGNASAGLQDISLVPLALVFGLIVILKKARRKP